MPRVLWKGAISFGLVHIPVTLHSATAESRMKFNLLDKRTLRESHAVLNEAVGSLVETGDVSLSPNSAAGLPIATALFGLGVALGTKDSAAGNRSRKDVLVDHGFRLPSARASRPTESHWCRSRRASASRIPN